SVLLLLLLAFAGLLASCDDDRLAREREDTSDPAARPPPEVGPFAELPAPVDAIPPEVAGAMDEWPLPNRTYDNARATTDSAIDSSNVGELGLAWSVPLDFSADWGAAAS